MFDCPAGIQLLLCFCAAALSLKFMLVQMTAKVYFCSCVVNQSWICAKVHFPSQFFFFSYGAFFLFAIVSKLWQNNFLASAKNSICETNTSRFFFSALC